MHWKIYKKLEKTEGSVLFNFIKINRYIQHKLDTQSTFYKRSYSSHCKPKNEQQTVTNKDNSSGCLLRRNENISFVGILFFTHSER